MYPHTIYRVSSFPDPYASVHQSFTLSSYCRDNCSSKHRTTDEQGFRDATTVVVRIYHRRPTDTLNAESENVTETFNYQGLLLTYVDSNDVTQCHRTMTRMTNVTDAPNHHCCRMDDDESSVSLFFIDPETCRRKGVCNVLFVDNLNLT